MKSRNGGVLSSLRPCLLRCVVLDVQVQKVATLEELEDILQNSGDAIVCVDFTATWCSPCQQIAPAVEQLAQELTDVVFLKVDVDENEVRWGYGQRARART